MKQETENHYTLTDRQWQVFNNYERLIKQKGIKCLTADEYDEYYKLALQVSHYCDMIGSGI